ncbi:MAG: hypothetical protein IJJ26_03970 [Victivallales bacterium]|nr:hypothetical protein [Victivallales bacterium]
MILRLTFQWLETHGGGRKRVFLASYHSFLIDVESLRRFGQLSEAELKDCGEEKKPTTDCPRLYAEDGVVGTREFHRLLRGESGENLKRMENPRNRMGRELLHTMLERIQEEDLREELRVILHDWKEGIIDALQNPNLSLHMGAGTQSEEAHRQLLVAVLVGFASFGWCISSAVVKQVYRKWETMRLKNQEEKSKRPAGESCPQGAMGGNPKRN